MMSQAGEIEWYNARHTFMINERGYVYRISPEHHNVRIGEVNENDYYEAYLNPKKKKHNCDYPVFSSDDLIQLGQLIKRFVADREFDKKQNSSFT